MNARFEARKQQLLEECEIQKQSLAGMVERLVEFAHPFLQCLDRSEQRTHGATYLGGLLSDLERKNTESIAYLYDHKREPLQNFLGGSTWAHEPLLKELATQVGQRLGEPDGVVVFDPSAHPKKGTESVGVQKQWCGRLGKLENCQVGIYMGYVSRKEQALVNVKLYLPEEWAKDKKRRAKCGVPKTLRFHTRHALALQMLQEHGALLPHQWIVGDDEMGRPSHFRRALAALGERYLLAVPSNTLIRDLRGERPRGKRTRSFERVDVWAAAQPEAAWTPIEVRAGEKGPLQVEIVTTAVVAKTEKRRIGPEELLVVTRTRQTDGTWKHDDYLSNAAVDTPREELARVLSAGHRIEECLQRAKGEAGLSEYEVRSYAGWYHHQTLSLIATWFLGCETERDKKKLRPSRSLRSA
jgi:SRSO17 transposase